MTLLLLESVFSMLTASAMLLSNAMYTAMPDQDIQGTLYLTNRNHPISDYYVPETRYVNATGMRQSMRDDAATALEALFQGAKDSGIYLATVSGYRSYSRQATIYQKKVDSLGSIEKADRLVARAGTSEHQLGMAMDVSKKNNSSLHPNFGTTTEGMWVNENAHRYGFIVHYLAEYEEITGYSYEPWHIRYVGIPFATAIYESKQPMETFVTEHRLDIYDYLLQTKIENE